MLTTDRDVLLDEWSEMQATIAATELLSDSEVLRKVLKVARLAMGTCIHEVRDEHGFVRVNFEKLNDVVTEVDNIIYPNAIIRLDLPTEFVKKCAADGVTPERVLRGFIGDLCEIVTFTTEPPRPDGYASNGSDERRMANEYYQRVGYPYLK